jgi:hypothetical protein
MTDATPPSQENNDGTALGRILRQAGDTAVLDTLARLSGADLTTLLLETMRVRARGLTPADVFRRHHSDRFVSPSAVPFARLRQVEDALLSAMPAEFEMVTLSPVAPLGTHSVLATVDQNKVVSTIRGSEVAADPTNALALEAALRRQRMSQDDPRSAGCVRLGAIQRVVRAQWFGQASMIPHFTLLGLVSAGRDTGNLAFERQHAIEHLSLAADLVAAAGGQGTEIRLTTLEERFAPVVEGVEKALSGRSDVLVVKDPDRASGRGYYTGLCFKVYATVAHEWREVGDGGFVGWTQKLLGNRKERLLISGIGVERLIGE